MRGKYFGVAVVAFLVTGWLARAPYRATDDVELSGPPGSGEVNLFKTSGRRAILTWLEPVAERRYALKVAIRENGTWSKARTIIESDRFFVNWADFPSLVELSDGTWIVHWLQRTARNTYAYGVRLALSRDYGKTWSEPIVPHRDDSPTEHGFVSMVPLAPGAAALIWLDGRAMAGGGHGRGAMSIRATAVGSDGTLGPDLVLDDRVCECCQTSLVQTPRGLVAAYRDRDANEIRDIAVVRFVDGSWTEPVPLHDDNWYYPGCPVNGPQLAAAGDTVVVAWFTAPQQKPAVYVAFSFDAGESFGKPIWGPIPEGPQRSPENGRTVSRQCDYVVRAGNERRANGDVRGGHCGA